MVGSAAIKQGRSANRKHTYLFFWPNSNHFFLQKSFQKHKTIFFPRKPEKNPRFHQ